jgi:LysR family cys regulon transcriptional activator
VSDAAEALFTSQPGISKQIRQLEDELGLSVFVRQGKRLASLTPAGEIVVTTARRALREIANMKRVADEFRGEDTGTLSIATTHTQARYVLPQVLREFATRYPKVKVVLHQGNPLQVAEQTAKRRSDIGIATEALADFPELVTMPCYEWNRVVIMPKHHPLAKAKPLTLEALAKFPIVTYDFSFTGRSAINAAFSAKGLEPNVVLTALDSDVIKTYVELGMGVGIIAQMAYDPVRDTAFEKLDASHLFAPSTTRLGLRHGVFLRGFVYAFITLFAPQYDRAAIDAALDARTRDERFGRPGRDARAHPRNPGDSRACWRRCRCSARSRSTCTCRRFRRSAQNSARRRSACSRRCRSTCSRTRS